MTVVLFVTHFFKRKNNYTFLFSTAISEGIKDMFKEMGYSPDGINKKKQDRSNLSFPKDQGQPSQVRS
jgi:hypothetical protein